MHSKKQRELDEFFLLSAYWNSTRSTCKKRKVGAVIVLKDKRLSDGYNGTPRGIANCDSDGCSRCNDPNIRAGERLDECVCIHAESNAIINAPRIDPYISLKNTTLYTTTSPCLYCAKEIIQTGITRVVYDESYKTTIAVNLFLKNAGIKIRQIKIDTGKREALIKIARV